MKSIKQNYIISNSFNKLQICASFCIFLNTPEVLLADKNDGSIMKQFQIDSADFVLDHASNRILTYNNQSNQVVSYDFDGKSQKFNTNLKGSNQSIRLVGFLNEKLLFLDSVSNCIYF